MVVARRKPPLCRGSLLGSARLQTQSHWLRRPIWYGLPAPSSRRSMFALNRMVKPRSIGLSGAKDGAVQLEAGGGLCVLQSGVSTPLIDHRGAGRPTLPRYGEHHRDHRHCAHPRRRGIQGARCGANQSRAADASGWRRLKQPAGRAAARPRYLARYRYRYTRSLPNNTSTEVSSTSAVCCSAAAYITVPYHSLPLLPYSRVVLNQPLQWLATVPS